MSSIVSLAIEGSTVSPTIIDGANLEIMAQQKFANIIDVEGDSPITITGGSLNDVIKTGAGDATLLGLDGNDEIFGGIGDDTILGGEGADTLRGGLGADFISGGDGNDVIKGGLAGIDSKGNPMGDTLEGGLGADIFEFVAGDGDPVVFNEFETGGVDQIVDFQDEGADYIRIAGVGDRGVSYDPSTGMVSIGGQEAIDIGTGLDLTVQQRAEGDETWELF